MVLLLLPSLATLPICPSLLQLVDHLVLQDRSSLLLLAAQLERDHLLLSAPYAPLLRRLQSSSCVRVCGVFLNQVSGKLVQVLQVLRLFLAKHSTAVLSQDKTGLEVVGLLLQHGSDLQVDLVVEELLHRPPGREPLLLTLAQEERGRGVLDAVLQGSGRELLGKCVDVLDSQEGRGSCLEVEWLQSFRKKMLDVKE